MGPLGMLIIVCLLAVNIEACLGLPPRLVFLLVLECDEIFVDEGERLGQVLLRVGVEVARVILDQLPQLLLLGLPDIATLAAIREHFDAFRHVDTRLRGPARAHLSECLSVGHDEIGSCSHRPGSQALLKGWVRADSVWIALDDHFLLVIVALLGGIVSLRCGKPCTLGKVCLRLASFGDGTLGCGAPSFTLHLSCSIFCLSQDC